MDDVTAVNPILSNLVLPLILNFVNDHFSYIHGFSVAPLVDFSISPFYHDH